MHLFFGAYCRCQYIKWENPISRFSSFTHYLFIQTLTFPVVPWKVKSAVNTDVFVHLGCMNPPSAACVVTGITEINKQNIIAIISILFFISMSFRILLIKQPSGHDCLIWFLKRVYTSPPTISNFPNEYNKSRNYSISKKEKKTHFCAFFSFLFNWFCNAN